VIIALMRRWRELAPRRAASLAEWSLVFEESVLCGWRVDRCRSKGSSTGGLEVSFALVSL
jgi:hypothetical protein